MPGLQTHCQDYRHIASDTDTMPETQTMPVLQAKTQCQGYRHTARTTDTDTLPGIQTQTQCLRHRQC